MRKYKVGVCGLGFVGSAVEIGFEQIAEIRGYDKFKPSESFDEVVKRSDIIFICLPTPMKDDGECDTSLIETCALEINQLAKKKKVVVIKSTVPPRTTEKIQKQLKSHLVVFNPEFLTEKNFINDFLNQKNIILGFEHKPENLDLERKLIEFYHDFTKTQKVPGNVSICQSNEAEMMKYSVNSFLTAKVLFFNEIYEICKALSIPYDNVKDLIQVDERIGNTHMNVPGHDGQFGAGGKCFPKDLNGLIALAKSVDVDPLILESVWSKNLVVREDYDWEKIPGATTKTKFKK